MRILIQVPGSPLLNIRSEADPFSRDLVAKKLRNEKEEEQPPIPNKSSTRSTAGLHPKRFQNCDLTTHIIQT